MNAPARDTRTYGQRRSDGRSFGPAPTPRRRRNRDFRPVLRINVLPALAWLVAMLIALFTASPQGLSIFAAIWGAP